MEWSPTDLLRQGIAAAKDGKRERARILLTQVVEQDERNVAAWLWLSGVVDSLDDREVCLENVLALDPENQAARKGLDWVREQKANAPEVYTPPLISEMAASSAASPLTPAAAILRLPPVEPESVPVPAADAPLAPDAPPPQDSTPSMSQQEIEARLSEFDDEYLCPYCARLTRPEDKACPTCHGQLWRYSRRLPEGSYWFWLLLGYLVVTALVRVYWFAVSFAGSIGRLFASGAIPTLDEFVGVYLGLHKLPPDVTAEVMQHLPPVVFWSFVISVSFQLLLALLVYLRWQPIYWLMVAVAGIAALFALAQVVLNYSPAALIGFVGALVPVLMLLRLSEDFMVNRERILCRPDKDVHSHSVFYMRGREYARKKMWALAAVHYQRATAGAPNLLAYQLALASAYARLKRFERAQSIVLGVQKIAPESPEVQELADLIAAARIQKQGAKRSSP